MSLTLPRDYITGATASLSQLQSRRCLDTLSALRDCGYRYFTCPIHVQLKVQILSIHVIYHNTPHPTPLLWRAGKVGRKNMAA